MKKFFSLLSLVMAVMCVSFVSCSSDDDIDDPIVSTPEFTSVKAKYTCEFTEATLKVATVVVKYTNEEGKIVEETISNPVWEKSVTINKPISECDLKVYITKRADSDVSEELGVKKIGIDAQSYDQNGNMIAPNNSEKSRLSIVDPEELDQYFALYADKPLIEKIAAFDKNGYAIEK